MVEQDSVCWRARYVQDPDLDQLADIREIYQTNLNQQEDLGGGNNCAISALLDIQLR